MAYYVPNLMAVVAGGHTYLGVCLGDSTADVLVLKDCMEILSQPMRNPAGGVIVNVVPVPISPYDAPAKVTIRWDVKTDASGDPALCNLYREATNTSGLVVPLPPSLG